LQFEPKYGKIIDYSLFGDGYIVIGFSSGYLSHVSAHTKEINEELVSERVFQTTLEAICSNEFLNKCAVAGEGMVKIFNMQTWKEIKKERITLPPNIGKISKISWSTNGQLLAISTTQGYLYGMLTHLPRLFSCYQNSVAILTSFTEITVLRTEDYTEGSVISRLNLDIEPGFIGIGPYHVVSGMNSYAYIYRYVTTEGEVMEETFLERRTDYFARILSVKLNKTYIAVLTEVNCYLQTLDTDEATFYERRYPENENEEKIIQIGLSEEFLILLDEKGKIIVFCLESCKVIYEYRPTDFTCLKIFPNHTGTKLVCIDKEANGRLLNMVSEEVIEIKEFSKKISDVIWDLFEPNLFCG
jgi:WD repeat-containing protein 19